MLATNHCLNNIVPSSFNEYCVPIDLSVPKILTSKIKPNVSHFPFNILDWDIEDVSNWLKDQKFKPNIVSAFKNNDIIGNKLLYVDEYMLDIIGVDDLWVQSTILSAIKSLISKQLLKNKTIINEYNSRINELFYKNIILNKKLSKYSYTKKIILEKYQNNELINTWTTNSIIEAKKIAQVECDCEPITQSSQYLWVICDNNASSKALNKLEKGGIFSDTKDIFWILV